MVEVTYRTVQGRFLLRPSQQLNEIIMGVFAYAQSFYPVELIGIVVLSNHLHMLLWVEDQYQLTKFMERFGHLVTLEVNRLYGWTNSIFAGRYHHICITEEEAAQVRRLEYLLSQAVKENLVAKVEHWPGIHSGKQLLERRTLMAGVRYDRSKLSRARHRGKTLEREEYATEYLVELHRLPCWKHLSEAEYYRRIEAMIRKIEVDAAAARKLDGIGVLGTAEVLSQDPHACAPDPEKRPAPLVHAATKSARDAFKEAFGLFLAAYREASRKLLSGDRSAIFPQGCFPPGLPYVGEVRIRAPGT